MYHHLINENTRSAQPNQLVTFTFVSFDAFCFVFVLLHKEKCIDFRAKRHIMPSRLSTQMPIK